MGALFLADAILGWKGNPLLPPNLQAGQRPSGSSILGPSLGSHLLSAAEPPVDITTGFTCQADM